jgi:hypothetical protein
VQLLLTNPLSVGRGQIAPNTATGPQLDLTFFGDVQLVSLLHCEHVKYVWFNSLLLTRKLEALDVIDAHIIVELHDGIELLLLFFHNLVL